MKTISSMPFKTQVRSIVDDRHLLGHPFYVAWSKGELSLGASIRVCTLSQHAALLTRSQYSSVRCELQVA